MENHVSEEEVRRLIAGRLEQDEAKRITVHLLKGCPQCRLHLTALAGALKDFEEVEDDAPPTAVAFDESVYDGPIDRAIAAVLEREVPRWKKERKRLERLLAKKPGWAQERPRRDGNGWAYVEALLQLSAAERYRDRKTMQLLALGAMLIARRLDPAEYGPALVADLQARATAEYANACRLNDEFGNADDYLGKADALVEEGTGDPLLLCRIIDIESSLRMDQRRLGDALEGLDVILKIYQDIGETHLAGRVLIKKGLATVYDGRPHEAVRFLRDGLKQVDQERDPQLVLTARHNLLLALTDSGKHHEASRMLLESGLREAFADDPVNLLRLRGVEGKIYVGRGRPGQAERAFREVREGFLDRGEEYDAALAGLELSGVLLADKGREAEVQQLSLEIHEVFQDLNVQSEARRAVRYFQEACRRNEATPALAGKVIDFLRRLEWQPHLRFAV